MVGIIDDTAILYPFGTRIKVGENYGTVKYVGEVVGYAGTWLGVEWDEPNRGKHDGCVDGKHYFTTEHPTAGSFVRVGKITPFVSVENATRDRYLSYSSNSLDESLIREAQHTLQASFFEVVGMDKIARKQSKFEQLTDVNLDGCPVNSAGFINDFKMMTTLNLSHTLVWNWNIIADICTQVPTLINLNLSFNRLLLPSDGQTKNLEPAFRNLKCINLSSCGYKKWNDVAQTAKLWPYIECVSLQENPIAKLNEINCDEIFKNLKELDLHHTKIFDFDEICKLGKVETLRILNLMDNCIEEIKFPDCEPNEKLNIFTSLEQLNLLNNPIWNETDAFNELDKLQCLKRLSKTPHLKSDFDEMFSRAVASISGIEMINKAIVSAEERRGAEYDIWKKYALDWLQASKSTDALNDFYKKHRSYAKIVKKYGSPEEFIPMAVLPQAKLIKINIRNDETGEIWKKRVPRMISVQTLSGLVAKRFQLEHCNTLKLSYVDDKHPGIKVPLENGSKSLDFYSIQDNDTVIVQW